MSAVYNRDVPLHRPYPPPPQWTPDRAHHPPEPNAERSGGSGGDRGEGVKVRGEGVRGEGGKVRAEGVRADGGKVRAEGVKVKYAAEKSKKKGRGRGSSDKQEKKLVGRTKSLQ